MAGTWSGTHYFGDDTNEVITGTAADETIDAGLGTDVITAGGGNDTVDSGLDSDTIFGGAGDDLLYDLNSFTSGFQGLLGKDHVFGGTGNDTVWFNSVDTGDVADGGAGIDTLVVRFDFLGATTTLPVHYALGPSSGFTVDGIAALSTTSFERVSITTGNGDDILTGGALDDTLAGGGGSDTLSGMDGNDLINVGTGNFNADGGAGTDTLILDLSNNFDAVHLTFAATFTVTTAQTFGTANGFEILSVISGSGDDKIIGGAGNDTINAGLGRDTLTGGAGDDHLFVGNLDIFSGNDAGDQAYGGDGNDFIQFGIGGNNTGYGGAGNDNLSLRFDFSAITQVNHLYGGDGNDSLSAGTGLGHLFGGAGNDVLGGQTGIAEAHGGAGNDLIIINGSVTDPVAAGQVLDGGSGFDKLAWSGQLAGVVDLTASSFTSATGSQWLGIEVFSLFVGYTADTVLTFGAGNDKLDGSGSFALEVFGGAGNDSLIGRSTDVHLNGGAGDDRLNSVFGEGTVLSGGKGNDILGLTNLGNATLSGGAGTDIAHFGQSVNASLLTGTAVSAAGTVRLSGIEGLTGSSQNDTLIGDAGDNQLYGGGFGSDVITTGGGADTLLIAFFEGGTSHVTDFNHASDSIGLNGFTYPAGLPLGALDPSRLVFGSFATAPTPTILGPEFFYDRSNGNLWFEKDGTGSTSVVLAMVFDNHPILNASDFIVGDFIS